MTETISQEARSFLIDNRPFVKLRDAHDAALGDTIQAMTQPHLRDSQVLGAAGEGEVLADVAERTLYGALRLYRRSLFDKSPMLPGEWTTAALQRTVALAQTADRLGYRRFWLAEHHGFLGLAGMAQEIVNAHLLLARSAFTLAQAACCWPVTAA